MLLINRLLKIVEIKSNGNKSEFYRKTGLSNGALDNIKHSASSKTIDKVISAFPDINKNWLLTGEGEMLLSNDNKFDNQHAFGGEIKYGSNDINYYKSLFEEKENRLKDKD